MRRTIFASAAFLVTACTSTPSPPPMDVTVVNPDLPSPSITTQYPPPAPDTAEAGEDGASDAEAYEADASDGDAGTCPRSGVLGGLFSEPLPSLTFDQQLAYECSRDAGLFSSVGVSTMECGGVIAIIEQVGVDEQKLYLYDPTTKACVEYASGANGTNNCIASASGVPLATGCTDGVAYALNHTGPFGFVEACGTDGGTAGDSATDAGEQ